MVSSTDVKQSSASESDKTSAAACLLPGGAPCGTPFDSTHGLDELLPGHPDAWIQSDGNLEQYMRSLMQVQGGATSEPLLVTTVADSTQQPQPKPELTTTQPSEDDTSTTCYQRGGARTRTDTEATEDIINDLLAPPQAEGHPTPGHQQACQARQLSTVSAPAPEYLLDRHMPHTAYSSLQQFGEAAKSALKVGVASVIGGGTTASHHSDQVPRRAHFMPTPPSSMCDIISHGSGPPSVNNSAAHVPSSTTPYTSHALLIGERDHKESFTEQDHHTNVRNMYKKTRRRHFTDPVDFEGILNIIGGCSWWQIWVYLLISLQQIPHAMFNLSVVYMMYSPDHWCEVPGFDMNLEKMHTVNWSMSEADVLRSDFLYKQEFNQARNRKWHSQCKYLDRPENVYHDLVHMNITEARRFIERNQTDSEVECTNWKYNLSVMSDTIVTEWDLVCTNSMKRAHAHLAYSLGFLVGCLLSGFSSDRFGRKPTVIGFGVLSSMFGLILPYSTYFPMFLLLRFLGAICNEAADLAAYVLCMEITGTKYRAMVGSLLQAPWACGYALLALIAYLTRSWRSIQLVTAALHTGAVLLVCVLPESPRWLIVNNRVRESEEIIRRACRMNNSYLPADLELVKHAEQRKWVGRNERANIFHLLKSRELLFRTLNIFVVWIATALVYYGLVIALSDQSAPDRALFAGNFFVNNAIAGAIELPTLLLCVLLLRWGRKRSQSITLIGAGIFIMCGMFAVNEGLNEYALAFFMMGKVCIQAAFNILYIFTSEMYPTVVRNSAVGVASMVARIGSATSSYVAILSDVTLPVVPMLIFSVFSLVAGLLVLLLPETRDQPLPDTLQDAVTFLKNDPSQYQSCVRPQLSKQDSNSSTTSPPAATQGKTPKSILSLKHQPQPTPTTIIEETASEIPPPSPMETKRGSFKLSKQPLKEESSEEAVPKASTNDTAGHGSAISVGNQADSIKDAAGKSESKTSLIDTPPSPDEHDDERPVCNSSHPPVTSAAE